MNIGITYNNVFNKCFEDIDNENQLVQFINIIIRQTAQHQWILFRMLSIDHISLVSIFCTFKYLAKHNLSSQGHIFIDEQNIY